MRASVHIITSQSKSLCILVVCSSVFLLSTADYASAMSYGKNREQVKMGEVLNIDYEEESIVIDASTTTIIGHYSPQTLFFLGSGTPITSAEIKPGQILYLFGTFSNVTKEMNVNKVVVRNTSKFLRKDPVTNIFDFSLWGSTNKKVAKASSTQSDHNVTVYLKGGSTTLAKSK